jgi:sugar phosphate isomerase/epimerase
MRLAISGQLLGGTQPLERIVTLFRTLEVDAMEVWPANVPLPEGATEQPEQVGRYEHRDVARARQVLAERDMTAACVTLGSRVLGRCAEAGPAFGTEALRGAVDAAASLGANVVNCYLAGLPVPTFVATVRPAAEYAGGHGVTIVLENEAHDDSGTAAGVRSIVEAVGSPHFGTLFDACNYYQAGEEAFPYAYEVLRRHVRYAHVKGGCRHRPGLIPAAHRGGTLRGVPDAHIGYVPIADGAVNIDGLLQRLARDGYRGFVTLEPHVPRAEAEAYYRAEVPYLSARLRAALAANGATRAVGA